MAVGENSFDDVIAGVQGDDNISATKNFISINSLNKYEFMKYAYDGNGPYRDGRFLIPHSREMFYNRRRELAYYKNFTAPIVNATFMSVFAEPIQRTIEPKDALFESFIKDVTNAGTDMDAFVKNVLKDARLYGVSLVVMDNVSDMPLTRGDAIRNRAYPYMYRQSPQTVDDYVCDKFGNLEWISFIDAIERSKSGESKCRYRVWTTDSSYLAYKKKGKAYDMHDIDKYELFNKHVHGLGEVPVIITYSNTPDDRTELLPEPPFYDIAKLNHAIYNLDSEIRDLERSQGFSILVIQDDSNGNLTVGPTNAIFVPTSSNNMPQFIAPDAGILTGLVANSASMRDELFRLADQLGVLGVKTESSGVALGYRFFGHETVLQDSSRLAAAFEQAAMWLFNQYTASDLTLNSEYPTDFQPLDTGGEVDKLDKYLMQDLTLEAETLALQKYTRLILGDQDPDKLADVLDSFDTRYNEKKEMESKEPEETEETEGSQEETEELTEETEEDNGQYVQGV